LAVLDMPEGAAHGQALFPGVLRVTDDCVFLEQNGRNVLLIWDPHRVRWDAFRTQINHRNDNGAAVTVADGAKIEIGGGGAQDFPEPYIERAAWLSEPNDACLAGGAIVVGGVTTVDD
jgi:hypothetical protein